ncbi:hypothetical protein ES319_A10G201100v1 [Gossypium barbadense]|uniref:Uncharacterized protein n=2 Tax=Gossypium TaxID=3633 RepID=A0A5J5U6C3_GOSBA|nr:hypothetical protein ES319_A10G201100v1 [Gossypium barbadense]TYG99811.1 hypothetical protein ES288_A10G225600v1 [Gossypium darwinii]
MVNQGFIGPPVRDFHSQTLNRYQVSIMTKQAEIQSLPNTGVRGAWRPYSTAYGGMEGVVGVGGC